MLTFGGIETSTINLLVLNPAFSKSGNTLKTSFT